MGGSISSTARQVAQSVAPARKLRPFSPQEIEALNRLAEQDQKRIKDMISMEELNSKDVSLDQFLNKLGGAISGRDGEPGPQPEASTSSRTEPRMPTARPAHSASRQQQPFPDGFGRPGGGGLSGMQKRRTVVSNDDQPGRLQSYIVKEILEERTAAAGEGRELDMTPWVQTHKADSAKLLQLMEYNCLPVVGKMATFGHQYAFARAPLWWLKEGVSGAMFVSEPEEVRNRLLGNAVAPGSSGGGMFRAPEAAGQGPAGGAGGAIAGGGAQEEGGSVVGAGRKNA